MLEHLETSEDLDSLVAVTGRAQHFMAAVREHYDERFGTWTETGCADGETIYRLTTGGWSHNEEVISFLRNSLFHTLFWHSSTVGGLEIYKVPAHQDLGEEVALGLQLRSAENFRPRIEEILAEETGGELSEEATAKVVDRLLAQMF